MRIPQQAERSSGISDITLTLTLFLFLVLVAGLDREFLEPLHDVFVFILDVPGFPFSPVLFLLLRLIEYTVEYIRHLSQHTTVRVQSYSRPDRRAKSSGRIVGRVHLHRLDGASNVSDTD